MTSAPKPRATVRQLPISSIRTDAGTQTRVRIDEATAAEYAERMLAGDRFPPVVVFKSAGRFILADGFHRVRAAELAKKTEIAAEVRAGSRPDAIQFSLAANHQHGLRRTVEDKRYAASLALREFPNLSDRALAELCGVSHPLVGQLRRQLVTVSSSGTRLGRDGKRRRGPLPLVRPPEARPQPGRAVPSRGAAADGGLDGWLGGIHCGDCRDLLPRLPAASVDAVITDAPYGVRKGRWDVMSRELAEMVVAEALRVMKPTASFFWFGANEIAADLWPVFKPLKPRWLTWFYRNNSNVNHQTFGWNSQVIVYGHKGKPVFNLDAGRLPYSANTSTDRVNHNDSTARFGFKKNGECIKPYHEAGRKPMDVLEFPAVTAGVVEAEGRWHPVQKPVKLMRLLVAISTNPGAVVLDPFCGGGTTCVAAKGLGRQFIGFEREPEFVRLARERLSIG